VTAGSVRAMAAATWVLGVTGDVAVTGWRGCDWAAAPTQPRVAAGVIEPDRRNHMLPKAIDSLTGSYLPGGTCQAHDCR
jgi:hypothetical protein